MIGKNNSINFQSDFYQSTIVDISDVHYYQLIVLSDEPNSDLVQHKEKLFYDYINNKLSLTLS